MPNSEKYVGRRLTMGEALGLPKLRGVRGARGAPTQGKRQPPLGDSGVPTPALAELRAAAARALSGPDGEQINVMTFGEQFVELLGEFVDAREQYAHSRRGVGGEYANPDEMNRAGDALQKLIDRRLP